MTTMRSRFRAVVGVGPTLPLLVLFGLNAVDELDRAAFAILAPEIRDEFGLGFQGLLTLIALVLAAALALQVPIAGLAELIGDGTLRLRGEILRPDGSEALSDEASGPVADGAALGRDLAARLLDRAGPDFFDWRS